MWQKFKEWRSNRQIQNDQALPQEKLDKGDPKRYIKLLYMWIALFFLTVFITKIGYAFIYIAKTNGGLIEAFDKLNAGNVFMQCVIPFRVILPLQWYLYDVIFSAIFTVFLKLKINYSAKTIAYGQKGDSRLTTPDELKKQFVAIPDCKKSFPGYGGIPISHYRSKYYIDTQTNHTIVVGTSRSGKGQTMVLPTLDNLSRAEKQSSMVINDPKGELYAAASETFRKRGYNVYLLNMDDPSKGMSYNPLSLVLQKWQQGDTENAIQLINSTTYILTHEDKPGSNKWVYDGAQSAINGMIIALMEYCMNPKNFDDKKAHPEKVTFNNIIEMTNELMIEYVTNPDNPFKTSLILDEYFKHLPQGSVAKNAYSSMATAPENGKASIVQTILEKLDMFIMPKMARMTSQNSFDLKSIGFPKYLSFSVGEDLYNNHLMLKFYKARKVKKETGQVSYRYSKSPDSQYSVTVKYGGFVEYNFADELKTYDKFEIAYLDPKTGAQKSSSWILKLPKNHKESNADTKVDFITHSIGLGVKNLKMHYDDKPTAVFLKLPDHDESNNALASIFISQLYSELARQCSYVKGGKTFRRVHMIFDEAGNMLPIDGMDHILTVSAGRNILFDLFYQSYKQIYALFGNDKGAAVKEGAQNQILIKTTDKNTLEEFSALAGSYTAEGGSVTKDKLEVTKNYNASADSVRLLTVERLSQMLRGESLVLRPLSSTDLRGNPVRPYPIFNKGDHKMPYAYTFLTDEFNPDTDPDKLLVDAPHATLDLHTLAINWEYFTTFDTLANQAFKDHNKANEALNSNNSEGHRQGETANNASSEKETQTSISEKQREEVIEKSMFLKHAQAYLRTGKINETVFNALMQAYLKHDEGAFITATNTMGNASVIKDLSNAWTVEQRNNR